MWKIAVLLIGLSGYCLAGPVGTKRNMPIVQQRDDAMAIDDNMAESESTAANVDPNEMLIMSTLNLPSNATSIRADITDGFSCENKTYGYYADVDNDCQIFHVCLPVTYADGKENTFRWSFICPEETIFSQDSFTCMRPDDMTISCEESYQYYELNRNFGMVESQADKEDNNEAPSENVSSNETVLEAENEPQAKPVIPEQQQQEEEKIDVKPVGQPRPIKPNRRKPVASFATQKKPMANYPLRKMPSTSTAISVEPVEPVPEDVSESASPVEEDIKPVVQKFSRRPVMSSMPKDKLPSSKPETMNGVRTELFNQNRKRPTMFNKKPMEAQEEEKREQLKIEIQPDQQNFSPVEPAMSNANTETQKADSEIQASATSHVFVKPDVETETSEIKAEVEKNEKPVQILEAFEEIPAVISEIVEIPKVEAEEITKKEETLPIVVVEEHVDDAEKSENTEEIHTPVETPEEIQVAEKEKPSTEEEMQASAEVESVKAAEDTQTVDVIQMSEESQKSEGLPEAEITQNLRSSAEVTQSAENAQTAEQDQTSEDNQTAEQDQIIEENSAIEGTKSVEQSADKTQIAQELQPIAAAQSADEVHAADKNQEAEKTEIVEDAEETHQTEEMSVQTVDEAPEKTDEMQTFEESQKNEQISDAAVEENVEENQSVEENQESMEHQPAEETIIAEEPQSVAVAMEDSKPTEESNTLFEEIKPVEENNDPKTQEMFNEKAENSAEPAIFEENSEEAANIAPVQTIEEMESEKPAEAPETLQVTDEMNQPDALVQQMYEDMSDSKQSIGGFKPVDPVMAHEAEQLIVDFINTLRKNDFTNETPGMPVKHQIDEEPEQQSQEAVLQVQESDQGENIKNVMNENDAEKQESEPQTSETLSDSVEVKEPTLEEEESKTNLKTLENQSIENMEETQKSEELQNNYISMPESVYQIPVQVITTPLEEVPQEQTKDSEDEHVQIIENSEEKAQEENPETTMGGYKPLSIDDIVELVKERLDHMPKNEMETPMQLEQVLGNTQEDKAPQEEKNVVEKQQEAQSEEQQQEETKQSEEEIVMPIYQRLIQPLTVQASDQTDTIEPVANDEQTDVQEESSRSYSSRSMLKKLDPRKRRFLFKSESS